MEIRPDQHVLAEAFTTLVDGPFDARSEKLLAGRSRRLLSMIEPITTAIAEEERADTKYQ